jgi:alpha-L-arabinofuranosidase
VLVVASANCLQPDGQNDNGWDQGLLFLNPEKVWLQPPGYVTAMVSRNYQPLVIDAAVEGGGGRVDVTATRSEDGKTVVLRVVNLDENPRSARIHIDGFLPSKPLAVAEELVAPLQAANTAAAPERVKPGRVEWRHRMKDGEARYQFAPHSFTMLRFE